MAVHSIFIGENVNNADVVVNEVPTGAIDGVNTVFVLANTPVDGTVKIELNGLSQEPGTGLDYTIVGDTVTFVKAPHIGSNILAYYLK